MMLLDSKKIFLNYIRWKLNVFILCVCYSKPFLSKCLKISAITISRSLRFVFFISEQLNIGHVKSLLHRLRCTHEWQRQKQTAPLKCIYYIIKMTILSMGISNNFVIDKRFLSAIGGCFDFEVRKPTKTTVGNFCNCL